MDAYIKDITPQGNNYNRFGKALPKEETRIDVREYFNCDAAREKFIIEKLIRDPNLEFNLVKPAGETGRQQAEEFKAKAFEEKKQATIKLETEEPKKTTRRK